MAYNTYIITYIVHEVAHEYTHLLTVPNLVSLLFLQSLYHSLAFTLVLLAFSMYVVYPKRLHVYTYTYFQHSFYLPVPYIQRILRMWIIGLA